MSNTDLAVEAIGLTKKFGSFTAVDGIDLVVPTGSVTSLLGPNGAGKTTTVRMLATLSAPTSGTAKVCGYDVVHQADHVRQVLSLTGQFAALEANLTARENLMLMAQLRGFNKSASKKIVADLVDRFDLGEFRDKPVKAVSGGQRRRTDLAASLVVQPQLLVLDEPTTGLDPRSRLAVWQAVRELVGQGVTVLLTTQYLEEADELADSIMLIDHGKAVATGTPSELKAQIGDHRVEVTAMDDQGFGLIRDALASRFEIEANAERRLISIPAPKENIDLAAVNDVLIANQLRVDEVALRRPTLDDAFLTLTGRPTESESTGEQQ